MWQMFCPGLMLALVPQLAPGRVREALVRPQPRRAVWWLPVSLSLTGGAVLAATAPLRFGIDIYQLLVDAARPLFAVGYGLIVAAAIADRHRACPAGDRAVRPRHRPCTGPGAVCSAGSPPRPGAGRGASATRPGSARR